MRTAENYSTELKGNTDEFYHACGGLHMLLGRQALRICINNTPNVWYTPYIIIRTHYEQRATGDNDDIFSTLPWLLSATNSKPFGISWKQRTLAHTSIFVLSYHSYTTNFTCNKCTCNDQKTTIPSKPTDDSRFQTQIHRFKWLTFQMKWKISTRNATLLLVQHPT